MRHVNLLAVIVNGVFYAGLIYVMAEIVLILRKRRKRG